MSHRGLLAILGGLLIGGSAHAGEERANRVNREQVSQVYKLGLSGRIKSVSQGDLQQCFGERFVVDGQQGTYNIDVTSCLGFGPKDHSTLSLQVRGSGFNYSAKDYFVDGEVRYGSVIGDVPPDINSYEKVLAKVASKYTLNPQCSGRANNAQEIARLALLCHPERSLNEAHTIKIEDSDSQYQVRTLFEEIVQQDDYGWEGTGNGLTMQYVRRENDGYLSEHAYVFPLHQRIDDALDRAVAVSLPSWD